MQQSISNMEVANKTNDKVSLRIINDDQVFITSKNGLFHLDLNELQNMSSEMTNHFHAELMRIYIDTNENEERRKAIIPQLAFNSFFNVNENLISYMSQAKYKCQIEDLLNSGVPYPVNLQPTPFKQAWGNLDFTMMKLFAVHRSHNVAFQDYDLYLDAYVCEEILKHYWQDQFIFQDALLSGQAHTTMGEYNFTGKIKHDLKFSDSIYVKSTDILECVDLY